MQKGSMKVLYTMIIWLTSCCVMIDGRKGQQWTSQAKLKASSCMNKWSKYEPGLYAVGTEPRVGIGQRAFLIQTSRTFSPPSLFYPFKVQDLHFTLWPRALTMNCWGPLILVPRPRNVEIEIFVWSQAFKSIVETCDRALNRMLYQHHPIHVGPCTH